MEIRIWVCKVICLDSTFFLLNDNEITYLMKLLNGGKQNKT